MSGYIAFFQGKPPRRFSLKAWMDDMLTTPLSETPLQVFDSPSAAITYSVYSTSIELIRVLRNREGQPSVMSEHKLLVLRGLQTCYLWDDLLFFSDLDSIYLCFPVILGKEPMKIKLATTFPYSTEEHLKPAGVTYFLGVIDQKVLVVTPTLDFTPISLTDTYLTYYFRLKAGNTKIAYEETKDLPNHEQEIIVRIALVVYRDLVLQAVQAGTALPQPRGSFAPRTRFSSAIDQI